MFNASPYNRGTQGALPLEEKLTLALGDFPNLADVRDGAEATATLAVRIRRQEDELVLEIRNIQVQPDNQADLSLSELKAAGASNADEQPMEDDEEDEDY